MSSPKDLTEKSPDKSAADLAKGDEAYPVVARLVVEVRSDGRRTVARSVIENHASGERTFIEARADSELALLGILMKAASGLTRLARRTARALAPRRGS